MVDRGSSEGGVGKSEQPGKSPEAARHPAGLLRRAILLLVLWLLVVPAVVAGFFLLAAFALAGGEGDAEIWRWLPWLFALPIALTALYVLAALTLARIPVNTDFRNFPDGVPVVVTNNGVHVDFLLPVVADGHDWRQVFDPAAAAAGAAQGTTSTHVAIGWGHRDFYLNTPHWAELTMRTAVRAVLGIGGTLVHVNYNARPDPDNEAELSLAPVAYQRLVRRIAASAVRDGAGRAKALNHHGYTETDAFYEARGHYSALFTCNGWASSVLSAAGVRVPFWSPFSFAVMRQVRAAISA